MDQVAAPNYLLALEERERDEGVQLNMNPMSFYLMPLLYVTDSPGGSRAPTSF
jgi:hypothetical protein